MKKLLFLLLGNFILSSCSPKETVEAQFGFDNAIQRIIVFDKDSTKEQLLSFVKNSSNADKTTYYFFYPKDVDVTVFSKESFTSESFYKTVIDSRPTYAFYKIPNDNRVSEDGIWVLKQAVR